MSWRATRHLCLVPSGTAIWRDKGSGRVAPACTQSELVVGKACPYRPVSHTPPRILYATSIFMRRRTSTQSEIGVERARHAIRHSCPFRPVNHTPPGFLYGTSILMRCRGFYVPSASMSGCKIDTSILFHSRDFYVY